jgi:glycosyltransferase involved in cell wall biosynthesis
MGRVVDETRGPEESIRIVGPVPHHLVPRWISSFDVCLLLADDGNYHYSPMKLYEYLACGKPVIAAAAGQVAEVMHERSEMLVAPGDLDGIVDRVERIASDANLAGAVGAWGRELVQRFASWDARADALLAALRERDLFQPTSQGL